jgi:glutamyl-tRNA synthetase
VIHRANVEKETSRVKEIVNIIGDRLKVIPDVETYGSFFFTDEIKYDEQELKAKLNDENVKKGLNILKDKFSGIPFDHTNIEQAVRDAAQELGLKAKEIIHPLRYVLTGKTVGPSLFEAVALLGRETVLKRLSKIL